MSENTYLAHYHFVFDGPLSSHNNSYNSTSQYIFYKSCAFYTFFASQSGNSVQ